MADQENYSSNLGDISSFLNTDNVVDHDWLDLTSGDDYDNYPSESKRKIVPQLDALWGTEQYSSPYRLVPNVVAPEGTVGKAVPIKEEDLFDVARVAKKAMMQGLKGPELVGQLRDRFDKGTLKAASGHLKKVAAEEGLLGNVYIDLSPFRNVREAAKLLSAAKIRLASFVIGSPYQEDNFIDAHGNCKLLKKAAVDKVDYTPEVLKHYATHLKNAGRLDLDAKITNREDLRLAFLATPKKAESLLDPEQVDKPEEVTEDTINQAMASITEQRTASRNKQALELRMAQVKPVLAKIQDMMLRGSLKDDLKTEIRSNFDMETIRKFSPEISSLVEKQGLIGPALVDASAYATPEMLVESLGRAKMSPKFMIETLPVGRGFMEKAKALTGLPVLSSENRADFSTSLAMDILAELKLVGKVDDEVVEALSKEAEKSPANAIKKAMLDEKIVKASKKVKMANAPQASIYSPVANVSSRVDMPAIRTAATKSIQCGISMDKTCDKVANFLPLREAMTIVREAMTAMDEIPASVMDKCTTQRYPLAKTASLVAASKCASCVNNVYGSCVAQDRPFKVVKTKTASTTPTTENIGAQIGLVGSSIVLDMNDVITHPKKVTDIELGHASRLGDI